jgi:histidinol-phosphate/aromatic aminotransferase/cobyric acid decarboxylase-like protein
MPIADTFAYLPPMYKSPHRPGGLKINPEWAYVPPVRPAFTLNLDREETTCLPAVSLAEADRRRQSDFPIQQSNRYPSKMIEHALLARLAGDVGLMDANVLVGNGIMNILTYIYEIYSRPGDAVTVPTPGFWPAYTYALQRARGIYMPLYVRDATDPIRPRFIFPADQTRACLERGAAICYLCNPNNPTGTLIPFDRIAGLVAAFPECLFVVDEAYGPFAAGRLEPERFELTDAVDLLKDGCPNLIVARTFSKVYALANLRVGYIMSHANNIATIKAHMGPYDMSEISLAMAFYNYLDGDYMKNVVRTVIRNMDAYVALLEENGIPNYGGYRNSLLVDGLHLGEAYERNGIAVRSMVYQPGIPNPIASTFRVTVPADENSFKFFMEVSRKIMVPSLTRTAR